MSYRVQITEQAQGHLRAILRDVLGLSESRRIAERFVEQLRDAILGLSRSPLRFVAEEREPWRSEGVRRMGAKGYYVYYWVDEETVFVTAVIAMRRDQAKALKKLNLKEE